MNIKVNLNSKNIKKISLDNKVVAINSNYNKKTA